MITKEKKALLHLMNEHCDCPDFSFAACKECEKAVKEIEKDIDFVDKHRWHDLRRNPNDLPQTEKPVQILIEKRFTDNTPTQTITTFAFYENGEVYSDDSAFDWFDLCDCKDAEYDEDNQDYIIPKGWWEQGCYSEGPAKIDDFVIKWREPFEEVENFCHEEIKTVPRMSLINTEEELKQAWDDYIDKSVDLNEEGSAFDFYMFLQEKIEVKK